MRLIAVPLARLRPGSQPVSTFLAQRAPIVLPPKSQTKPDDPVKKLPLASRLSARASAFWMSLGDPNAKSTFDWKKRTYRLGEGIMDRIEYEEWALKGIDPALAPSLKHPTSHQTDADESADSVSDQVNVPLLYPPSLLKPQPLLRSLQTLASHRTPHHRKWMWVCLIGAPLTAPFALVPVIPNLPFFYLAWRAWSHWKAYQSSAYLSELIAQNRLVPTASKELDNVYNSLDNVPRIVHPKMDESASEPAEATQPSPSRPADSEKSQEAVTRPELLLTSMEQIQQIITALEIDEKLGLKTDLRRAMEQTLKLLQKGETAKLEAADSQHVDTEKKTE
ncbi:hypothetical protein OC846_005650 [Tilletia horrida]|uniref:Mitochondrial K+-H+ exchange-related-domain-containing protein n=1 Tax=Tilletia horrida TaxID=155126 RepID=A0AAN6GKD3_9BASI|nr:hypothetical protein OC846_005650 [Tilletia horrida]